MFDRLLPDALKFDASRIGWPLALLIALGAAGVIYSYTAGLRWHHHVPLLRRLFLLSLRLAAVACLVFALLHPTWDVPREQETLPWAAVVLDTSQSMAAPAAAAPADGQATSRYAKAVTLLRDQIQPALAKTHRLAVFDIQGEPLEVGKLPEKPQAASSPILETLQGVEHELAGEPLAATLLLSDGNEVSTRLISAAPGTLKVPVFPVDVTRPAAGGGDTPDLVLQSVATNRTALMGNAVRVTVDVGARGNVGAVRVPVSILDGDRVLAGTTVQWHPDQPLVRTQLDFIPPRPGNFQYLVEVGRVPGEVNLENNRRTFSLNVRAKALKVMYVDGVLRWEGKFIREAMTADPDISVVFSVRTAAPGTDNGSHGLLLADSLEKVDLVILGDVEATYFSARELDALRKWITDKGGALVLTGGYHSFGPKGFGATRLQEILPVLFSAQENPQVEQPFPLTLTPAGEECPVFDLTGNRLQDADFYHKLPELGGCSLVAGVKPGAQVLAVNPRVRDPKTGGPLPVMAVQQVGRGKTMVFSVDTTWRWRMVVGGFTGDTTFYQRFWGQMVRWLTGEGEETRQTLNVATDRYHYQPNQTVRFNVELGNKAGLTNKLLPSPIPGRGAGGEGSARQGVISGNSPHPGPLPAGEGDLAQPPAARHYRVLAQALDEENNKLTIPLAELPGGRYEGSFPVARPGRWDLIVAAEPESVEGGHALSQSQVITVQVDRPDLETFDLAPRPQWLTQLAQQTGGQHIQPDENHDWLKHIPGQTIKTAVVQPVELWRNPWLATLFLGLLCVEWIVRRWKRLA